MTYIRSISSRISHMDPEAPFVIADYGAADGVNSSSLFEKIIEEIYKRLREKFYETPKGLPYEYCLLELIKK